MLDAEWVSERAVREWFASDYAALEPLLPRLTDGGAALSEEQLRGLQTSCQVFINWLDSQGEEEGDEHDEDEEAEK